MAANISPGSWRVVAVQLTFSTFPNFEAVREYLLGSLLGARRLGARLAVMPAFTGLLTLPLFAQRPLTSLADWREAAWRFGDAAEETLLDWARGFARVLDVYLVPGTCLVPGTNGLLHRAYIVDPGGNLLGCQSQTHVRAWERQLGLVGGTELPAWDVDGFRLGLAVGSDAWTPEVGRILALQGVTLMACATAVPSPYLPHWQMAGPWQQVQANGLYGIESALDGTVAGLEFQGRSSVFAPLELTPGGRGYLSPANSNSTREPLVAADLNLARLLELRKNYVRERRFNTAFYARSFPRLYLQRLASLGLAPVVEEV